MTRKSIPSWLPTSWTVTDVRMTQGRERLGFALEPLLQVRIGGDVLGQDFDGDRAVQASVGRFVDLAHAASADRGGNHVRAEPRAGGQRHGWLRCVRILQGKRGGHGPR